jgi:hypothetical protein
MRNPPLPGATPYKMVHRIDPMLALQPGLTPVGDVGADWINGPWGHLDVCPQGTPFAIEQPELSDGPNSTPVVRRPHRFRRQVKVWTNWSPRATARLLCRLTLSSDVREPLMACARNPHGSAGNVVPQMSDAAQPVKSNRRAGSYGCKPSLPFLLYPVFAGQHLPPTTTPTADADVSKVCRSLDNYSILSPSRAPDVRMWRAPFPSS